MSKFSSTRYFQFLVMVLPFVLSAVGATGLWLFEPYPEVLSIFRVTTLLYLLVAALPDTILRLRKEKKNIADFILSLDFLWLFASFTVLAKGIYEDSLDLHLFYYISFQAALLSIRYQAARRLTLIWSTNSLRYFSEILDHHKKFQLLSMLILILLAAALKKLSSPFLYFSLLPIFTPVLEWSLSRTNAIMDRFGFYSRSIFDFISLKRYRGLIFHQHGVLAKKIETLENIWIDTTQGFEKEEIQDAMALLSQPFEHPINKILARSFHRDNPLLHIESVRSLSHLGIEAQLRDLKNQGVQASLGSWTWHRIQKHEISEEGLQMLREWRSSRKMITLLSMNRFIVGAVAWDLELHPQSLETLSILSKKFKLLCFSSCLSLHDDLSKDLFKDSEVDLLSVERQSTVRRWLEREKKLLEVTADWDDNLVDQLVIESSGSKGFAGLQSRGIQKLPTLFNESQSFSTGIMMSRLSALGIGIYILASNDLAASFTGFLCFYLCWALFFTRRLPVAS